MQTLTGMEKNKKILVSGMTYMFAGDTILYKTKFQNVIDLSSTKQNTLQYMIQEHGNIPQILSECPTHWE